MVSKTGYQLKVTLWSCVLGLATADVVLRGVWKENLGWDVTCLWETWLNDTLQSVRMYRNDVQYAVYRPEKNGPQFSQDIPSEDFLMSIKCRLASAQGQRGACQTHVELHRNSNEDTFKCEVSGEGPRFRLETKEYTVFVPPSDAEVHEIKTEGHQSNDSRRVLNCTSSGLPAPKLIWRIDGQKNQIPSDFSNKYWNETSKLWHSWSSLNPQLEQVVAVCTPVATTKSGQVERGRPAEYHVNSGHWTGSATATVMAALVLALLR